jgi:hypothetical protein
MFYNSGLYLVTDVSEQPIGPIVMDAAVQINPTCIKPLVAPGASIDVLKLNVVENN